MALVEDEEEWASEEGLALTSAYPDSDFIELHIETVGVTNVPRTLLEWAALGTLAGLVQDRIGVKLYPDAEDLNLAQFIVLIAASGAGKGRAIEKMAKLVNETFIRQFEFDGTIAWRGRTQDEKSLNERLWTGLHIYNGSLTRAAAQDLLSEQLDPQTGCKGHAKLWWIAEEMSHCFVSLIQANETIKQLVAWKEKTVMSHQSKVRKDGKHLHIKDPCVNMLAGSTWDWLGEIMTKKDATGGLLRRTHYVEATYDITKKTLDEKEVPDAEARKAVLRHRIYGYAQVRIKDGLVKWGPGSREAFRAWFETGREIVPTDPAQYTLHSNRESEVVKLAALSALSRWDARFTSHWPAMTAWDIERAVRWWEQAFATAPKLWMHTSGGEAAQKTQIVMNVMEVLAKRCEGVVEERLLAKTLASQSFVKRDVDEAIGTLLQQGVIRRTMVSEKWVLMWQGR